MVGRSEAVVAVKHTELMTEMEESFASTRTGSENNDSAVELRRWQQWRDTEPAGLHTAHQTGSAARPIEIDGAEAHTIATTPHRREGEGDDAPLEETETLWGHAVHVHELSPGDQIYVYRGAIQHHGIVTHVPWAGQADGASAASGVLSQSLGAGVQVVHFDSTCDGVETTSLESFLKGGTLRKATYAASAWSTGLDYGASYGCTSDDPALIVTRAKEAAKFGEGASGWSGYSLLTNNCETFAYWCSTGRRQTLSRQATRGLVGAGIVAAGVSAIASTGGLASAGMAATALVPRGVRGVQRGVQALEWATGVAIVAVAAADVVSTLVTRAPVARNVNLPSDHSGGDRGGGRGRVSAVSY
eukprot:g14288.t1